MYWGKKAFKLYTMNIQSFLMCQNNNVLIIKKIKSAKFYFWLSTDLKIS